MPASLAHFMVCDDAVRIMCVSRPVSGLVKSLLKEFPSYVRLGSIGPDLPYFASPVKTGIFMLLDINLPIEPFGHLLHCRTPGLFACNLLSAVKADLGHIPVPGSGKKQTSLRQVLAFALGYLTHIASDTTVHPVVNKIAGSFYLSERNQTIHREIEICQDVLLFGEIYGKNSNDVKKEFMSRNFAGWIDLLQDSPIRHLIGGWDTGTYFRTLLQRAFLETYGNCPEEKDIENWVDGALSTLEHINHTLSPYTRTLYKADKRKAEKFFVETRYYDENDSLAKLAEEIRRKKTKAVPVRIMNDKQTSLYGRAIRKSCRYIRTADDFLSERINYRTLALRINDSTLM